MGWHKRPYGCGQGIERIPYFPPHNFTVGSHEPAQKEYNSLYKKLLSYLEQLSDSTKRQEAIDEAHLILAKMESLHPFLPPSTRKDAELYSLQTKISQIRP